jgi:transposase
MQVLHRRCAGLDLHKDLIVASVRLVEKRKVRRERERFGTTTRELMRLAEWLRSHDVSHVIMEATGVYWKPVWHVLEGQFEVTLANAADVRNVPGRKSDVSDADWFGELHAHGLVRASFVPPRPIRELRDLTRTRRQTMREVVRQQQRIDKILQDANIKLSSVLSDMFGPSGMRMLEAIAAGETSPGRIAELGSSRLTCTREELTAALEGHLDEHHRFMIGFHLRHLKGLEAAIADLDRRIEEHVRPFREAVDRIAEVPGVKRVAAAGIIAEIGADMSVFPTDAHLRSWSRIVSRLDESAGKKRSRRVKKGGAWLKPLLVQCARAAVKKKGSYYGAQYRRLKTRIGDKKAILAVAASLLTAIYHMLKSSTPHRDLGAHYLERRDADDRPRMAARLLNRLQLLGYEVQLTPAA